MSLVMTYAILQAQQAPRWQIKLDNYIKYRNDTLSQDPLGSGTVTVEQVSHARHPENFHKTGDKKLVVGNYYWLMAHREALLAPPEAVMCALLREATRSNEDFEAKITYQTIFVANYSQTVEPDWLVYEGEAASAIGCDLEWEQ
jgi:hypothetical protein